jgi:hypothetical protein
MDAFHPSVPDAGAARSQCNNSLIHCCGCHRPFRSASTSVHCRRRRIALDHRCRHGGGRGGNPTANRRPVFPKKVGAARVKPCCLRRTRSAVTRRCLGVADGTRTSTIGCRYTASAQSPAAAIPCMRPRRASLSGLCVFAGTVFESTVVRTWQDGLAPFGRIP